MICNSFDRLQITDYRVIHLWLIKLKQSDDTEYRVQMTEYRVQVRG